MKSLRKLIKIKLENLRSTPITQDGKDLKELIGKATDKLTQSNDQTKKDNKRIEDFWKKRKRR